MIVDEHGVVRRFHQTLVREIHGRDPQRLGSPFTVAEIYQDLVPYRTHRDRLGVEMNADYEHALLRLLAGEGGFLTMESEAVSKEMREELDSPNPNTGLYREFAAADVRLNLDKVDAELLAAAAAPGPGEVEIMAEDRMEDQITLESGDDLGVEAPGVDEAPSEGADSTDPEMEEELASGESVHQVSELEPRSPRREVAHPVKDVPAEDDLPFENCPWCRESLPQRPGVLFCPFCGSNVRLVPCAACGEELELNWRFCVACGTEVQS